MKTGKRGFWEWLDAIFRDSELREIAADGYFDIRLIAIRIAKDGADGRSCFATAETVAADIGCKYKTVERYRAQLIDLGWFKVVSRNGGWNRRGLVLDISIPNEANGDGAKATA